MYLPRKRSFWSVGIGHFTNDIFMSSGIVLLTFLSSTLLPMSNTQIGFAVSMTQLTGAFSQPFFGIRADRTGGRWIGAGGLAWVVSCFTLALLLAITTHNYYIMLIPYILMGLGSGAVHPVGSLHAAEADVHRVATNMSYFFLLGQAGLALGPTLVGLLLDWANHGSLLAFVNVVGFPSTGSFPANVSPIFFMTLAAIPSIAFFAYGIPTVKHHEPEPEPETAETPAKKQSIARLPFIILGGMVLLRSLANPGSVNFIPVLFEQKGWSPAEYGLITSFFWLAAGISGVVMGNLADRFDRRYVVMGSMVLSAPAFYFLPMVDGLPAFLLAVLAGGFSGGAHSIIVVLAQEMVPRSKGFASGSILGFIFGAGALGSLLIGIVSDQIGLGLTFQAVAVAVALAGMVALLLPKRSR
ncbi:MAG: MFS transporter [Anaerolineae bacterium]|nr:MFS transporter [Anaerolineae bacterium]